MTLVVKVGGELLTAPRRAELEAVRASLARLREQGERLVVTHGGGPQVTALMRARSVEPRIVAGRRVTDEAALDALLMAVGGEVNARLTSALLEVGLRAVGLNGLADRCVSCVRQPPRAVASADGALVDYGHVGDVVRVDRGFLDVFLSRGLTPVLACIGADARGRPLNVNGDALATAVAGALSAERLVFLTGAPGVLRDPNDSTSRVPRMSRSAARETLDTGALRGGMIAKMEEALAALEMGVARVHILGRLGPGDLERAIEVPGSLGTTLEEPS